MYFVSMTTPSAITVDAWVCLLRAQETALATVERALKRAGLPPLAWYDVLLELERGGTDGLRPFELQAALLLPQYGVSRLLDRMEKAGYLQKTDCPGDGRGQVLILTEAGRAVRAAMWPVYGAAIQDAIGDRLTPGEARILTRILGKLSPPHGGRT